MKKIYKYELTVTDHWIIQVPVGEFKPLSVQYRNGKLCLWALVTPSEYVRYAHIYIHGTGNPVEDADNQEYIGTAQNGSAVWHVFWTA